MRSILWVILILAVIAGIWWLQFKRKMRASQEGSDCGCDSGDRCKTKMDKSSNRK